MKKDCITEKGLVETLRKRFSEAGWQVMKEHKSDSSYRADIALSQNDEILGLVEVIDNTDLSRFAKKVEMIRNFVNLNHTPLFIITDGTVFYVSVFGANFEATTMLPSPQGYFAIKASIVGYLSFINGEAKQ